MWQDNMNGLFEFCSGFFILLHCIKMFRDKKVQGVSILAVIFFTAWSYWNLHYYPHLHQWWSFGGGAFTTLAHTIWASMTIYYLRKGRNEQEH
ncbi:hypothetical protein LCGC14_0574040 [marine sediment metagenome]|uniref:Uncharacterized protein n=1 Tax=marine sediment metagenome TaxID=412755 RepID=A0A0F9RNI2_9ZZZZ